MNKSDESEKARLRQMLHLPIPIGSLKIGDSVLCIKSPWGSLTVGVSYKVEKFDLACDIYPSTIYVKDDTGTVNSHRYSCFNIRSKEDNNEAV